MTELGDGFFDCHVVVRLDVHRTQFGDGKPDESVQFPVASVALFYQVKRCSDGAPVNPVQMPRRPTGAGQMMWPRGV